MRWSMRGGTSNSQVSDSVAAVVLVEGKLRWIAAELRQQLCGRHPLRRSHSPLGIDPNDQAVFDPEVV